MRDDTITTNVKRVIALRNERIQSAVDDFLRRDQKAKKESDDIMREYERLLEHLRGELAHLNQRIAKATALIEAEVDAALAEGVDPLLLRFTREPALTVEIVTRREFRFRLRCDDEFEGSVKRTRGQYVYEGLSADRLSRYAPVLGRPCRIHVGREEDFLHQLLAAATAAGLRAPLPTT